jgi:hypothetical protein
MTKATLPSHILWAAVCTAMVATSSLTVEAQKKTRPKLSKDRIELLESEVDALEEQLKEVHGDEAPDALRTKMAELQAKIDEISAQLIEVDERGAAAAEANEVQDARVDDVAVEVSKLLKDVETLKERIAALEAARPAGYDEGFFIQSQDGNFRLTLNGTVRPYYQVGLQKTWDTDEHGNFVADEGGFAQGEDVGAVANGFGVANAFLKMRIELLEVLFGEIEIDYGTPLGMVQYPANARVGNSRYNRVEMNEHVLRFLDAYGEYRPIPEFGVRIGQFNVPFDREGMLDPNELTFSHTSLMTRAYPVWGDGLTEESLTYNWEYDLQRASSFGYDRGLQLHGEVSEGIFNYAVGVFNGSGPNTENDNRDVLVALRLSTDPVGKMTAGLSDLDTVKDPLFSLGAAFAYDLLEHKNLVDPLVSYNSSDVNIAADFLFKWYGVSVMGALFFRNADHGAAFVDDDGDPQAIKSLGTTAQISYFNEQTGLEPGFRYSLYDADMELELDHAHEITGTLAYHPFVKHLKIQVEYRGVFVADTYHVYLSPWNVWYDHYNEITLMAQLSF